MNAFGPLRPVQPPDGATKIQPLKPAGKTEGGGFENVLSNFVGDIDKTQQAAEAAVQDFATGKVDNVHDMMIAMGKAEVSFKFMMEVRNRLLSAYQEIMRMPV